MPSSEDVRFASGGGPTLTGTLTTPDAVGRAPGVVAVHGASGGIRDFVLFRHLASFMPARGVATLTFDRRGEGASSGSGGSMGLGDLADDVRAAVRFLRDQPSIRGAGHLPTLPDDPADLSETGPIAPGYERAIARWLTHRLGIIEPS